MSGEQFKKILIIRGGAIGDVVHTSALLEALKKANPEVQIHYLSDSMLEFMFKSNPTVDKFHSLNCKFKLFSSYTLELAETLKKENYDLVINLQPSFRLRVLTLLAGIKKEFVYRKNFKLHAVTNFWRTGLKAFPNLEEEKTLKMYLSEDALTVAKNRVKNFKRPLIVINAGGMFSKRQGRAYPVDKWVELGNQIQEKYNGTIILNGAKEDKEFLTPLNNIQNSVNYIGELSLEDSCGVISQSDLMLSGDSGPLHIATALGIKSIGLYGSMPIERTGCYSNGVSILSPRKCAPCNRRKCKYLKGTNKIYAPCMEDISVDSILQRISF